MPSAKSEMIDRIWYGKDPFAGGAKAPVDHHGWNSHHLYLTRAIETVRPRVVVEVGVWKGGSVMTMAEAMKVNQIDGAVIAIDTWLGSSEHWTDRVFHEGMNYTDGYPRLFHVFAANVLDRDLQDYVVPLPLDSVNAFHVLKTLGIKPDVLHIDAGHDFESATADLRAWWPFLAPGGVLVGDDYFADGSLWPEVRDAFDAFFGRNNADVFESGDAKCFIRKPF